MFPACVALCSCSCTALLVKRQIRCEESDIQQVRTPHRSALPHYEAKPAEACHGASGQEPKTTVAVSPAFRWPSLSTPNWWCFLLRLPEWNCPLRPTPQGTLLMSKAPGDFTGENWARGNHQVIQQEVRGAATHQQGGYNDCRNVSNTHHHHHISSYQVLVMYRAWSVWPQ